MIFQKLLNKIYPQPPIGGLAVSDMSLRLTVFVKGHPSMQAYALPQGVVEKGEIKNREAFLTILKELRERAPQKGKLAVVLTLPDQNIFIQTVKLPPAARGNLEEAAALNTEMISPLKQGEFYYDWQRVGKDMPGAPVELLAAFVMKNTVDDFSQCLREAGLSVVAVEFGSLSLTRELVRQKILKEAEGHLIAEVRPEGTTFALTKGGALLFHSFHSLGEASETGEINVQSFLDTLKEEVQNISNFYLTHWGEQVSTLIFVAGTLTDEIKNAFRERAVTILDPREVTSATGAAMREILGEKEINLLGVSSLKIYEERRALTFVSLWRTVLVSTLAFLIILALGADIFLRQLAAREMEANALTLNEPGHRELVALRDEASKFNDLVALIEGAREEKSDIGSLAGLINNTAGVDIRITRLYLPSLADPVTLAGVAESEQAAIAFKNRLAATESFAGVDLPISSIAPETGGKVRFTIYLKLAE